MNIRPAIPQDAPAAADLLLMTMRKMGEVIFGLDDPVLARTSLGRLFQYPDNRFSFSKTVFSEADGRVSGLLLSFAAQELPRLERPLLRHMLRVYPFGKLLHLGWRARLLSGSEVQDGEYYIAHLAVYSQDRGRGVGSALLEVAEQKCRQAGLKKCSLCVDVDNINARNLYLKSGYRVAATHLFPLQAARVLKERGFEHLVKEINP